jgi:DHA1 family bicyclomycin/chloramphenicol resistance-like MFS transporter
MLATGVGPILAPQFGAEILRVTSWRGIFVALAIIASALFVSALFNVPETLPPDRRNAGGMRSTIRTLWIVGRDRSFISYALVLTLGFGAVFAYIAGSPFVLQDVYGLSPQVFGFVFAINAVGLVLGAQINGHLLHRFGSGPLLSVGLILMGVGGLVFLADVATRWIGLPLILPSLFTTMFGLGFVGPNSMALALQNHPNAAGAASALLGSAQFLFAAAVAPIVGVAGSHTALPMALVMAALASVAVIVRFTFPRGAPAVPIPVDAAPVL